MRILANDPGLANFGWVVLHEDDHGLVHIDDGGLIRTKASSKKLRVRKTSDDRRRLGEVLDVLVKQGHVAAIVSEERSHVRSATVSAQLGAVYGALHTLGYLWKSHHLEVPSSEVRKFFGAKSKQEVAAAASVRLSNPQTLREILAWYAPSTRDHIYDALAVGLVGIHTLHTEMGW